jgi:hypothetical protein
MQRQRFDPATTQQVIGLAARLKDQKLEQLSQAQIEAIAADVGIEPEYVRQSLLQIKPASASVVTVTQKSRAERSLFLARWFAFVCWVLPIVPFFLTGKNGRFDSHCAGLSKKQRCLVAQGAFSGMECGRMDLTGAQPDFFPK